MATDNAAIIRWKNFGDHVYEICKSSYGPDSFCGMSFLADRSPTPSNRILLSTNSPFYKMLTFGQQSLVQPNISVPDAKCGDMENVMSFVCAGKLMTDPKRVHKVLNIAASFQVNCLMKVEDSLNGEDTLRGDNGGNVNEIGQRVEEKAGEKIYEVIDIQDSSDDEEAAPPQGFEKFAAGSANGQAENMKRKMPGQDYPVFGGASQHPNDAAEEDMNLPGPSTKKARTSPPLMPATAGGSQGGNPAPRKATTLHIYGKEEMRDMILKQLEKKGFGDIEKRFNIHISTEFYDKRSFLEAGELNPSVIKFGKREDNNAPNGAAAEENNKFPMNIKEEDGQENAGAYKQEYGGEYKQEYGGEYKQEYEGGYKMEKGGEYGADYKVEKKEEYGELYGGEYKEENKGANQEIYVEEGGNENKPNIKTQVQGGGDGMGGGQGDEVDDSIPEEYAEDCLQHYLRYHKEHYLEHYLEHFMEHYLGHFRDGGIDGEQLFNPAQFLNEDTDDEYGDIPPYGNRANQPYAII